MSGPEVPEAGSGDSGHDHRPELLRGEADAGGGAIEDVESSARGVTPVDGPSDGEGDPATPGR